MSLRLANEYDIPEVLSLCERLHAASVYSKSIPFVRDDALATIRHFLGMAPSTGCIVLLLENDKVIGFFMMTYMNHLYNKREKTAVEVAFWIDEDKRTISNYKQLLGSYKYWAKKTGCNSMMLGKLKSRDEIETYVLRKVM